MRRSFALFTSAVMISAILAGCGSNTKHDMSPLLGLSWFMSYDDVKEKMDENLLHDEREADDNIHQTMQDYADIELFGEICDLTLCFTDSGLIGFNYHDIDKNLNYREWFNTIETNYGIPTEEGSGMASWYGNPLGKNTAVYLFNLEEGVQVSFYATADTPDKSYDKEDTYIPTPEIRTPIVPVPNEIAAADDDESSDTAEEKSDDSAEVMHIPQLRMNRENITDRNYPTPDVVPIPTTTVENEDEAAVETTDVSQTTAKNSETTVATTASTVITTSNDRHETPTEPVKENPAEAFLLNDLKFYGSLSSERKKMSAYKQLYEYKNEVPGQPLEIIMEYENVSYLGKKCNGILCFTSIGLVGINYFDYNANNYSYWVDQLTEIYGEPDEKDYDYMAWSSDPVGKGTVIYAFALEDGVQISFFADDTGSE